MQGSRRALVGALRTPAPAELDIDTAGSPSLGSAGTDELTLAAARSAATGGSSGGGARTTSRWGALRAQAGSAAPLHVPSAEAQVGSQSLTPLAATPAASDSDSSPVEEVITTGGSSRRKQWAASRASSRASNQGGDGSATPASSWASSRGGEGSATPLEGGGEGGALRGRSSRGFAALAAQAMLRGGVAGSGSSSGMLLSPGTTRAMRRLSSASARLPRTGSSSASRRLLSPGNGGSGRGARRLSLSLQDAAAAAGLGSARFLADYGLSGPDDQLLERPYTISRPVDGQGGRLVLYVRRYPTGSVSRCLTSLPVGSKLLTSLPRGLGLRLDNDAVGTVVCVSQGTGLVTMLDLVHHVADAYFARVREAAEARAEQDAEAAALRGLPRGSGSHLGAAGHRHHHYRDHHRQRGPHPAASAARQLSLCILAAFEAPGDVIEAGRLEWLHRHCPDISVQWNLRRPPPAPVGMAQQPSSGGGGGSSRQLGASGGGAAVIDVLAPPAATSPPAACYVTPDGLGALSAPSSGRCSVPSPGSTSYSVPSPGEPHQLLHPPAESQSTPQPQAAPATPGSGCCGFEPPAEWVLPPELAGAAAAREPPRVTHGYLSPQLLVGTLPRAGLLCVACCGKPAFVGAVRDAYTLLGMPRSLFVAC